MKKEAWIVVANSSQARILKIEKGHRLQQIYFFDNPEGRMHPRDLYADKPGTTFQSVGHARSSLEQKNPPKQQEIEEFAKQICECIEAERNKGGIAKLYIAASPAFLGCIRQALSPSSQELIEAEIDKDITHLTPVEIEEYLAL